MRFPFFVCLLLSIGAAAFAQKPNDRLPAVPATTPPVVLPAAELPIVPAHQPSVQPPAENGSPETAVKQPDAKPTGTKQLRLQNGFLEVPKRNHALLAAPERAVLMSLKTQKKDAAGNDETVPLVEGINVVKGQVLGNFDDRELRSALKINETQLEVANAEKDKRIELVYAARGVQLAHTELEMMREANRLSEKTFPEIDIRKAELAYQQAEANLELQKYTMKEVKTREVAVREAELERTKTLIALRQLVSPIDGVIVKVNAAEGEWLREGDPVVEIVNLDTLLVRGNVSIKEYAAEELDGKSASVFVTLSGGKKEKFEGKVVFCDPKVQAGDFFHVYIEVQNRRSGKFSLLQPGRGDVEIAVP